MASVLSGHAVCFATSLGMICSPKTDPTEMRLLWDGLNCKDKEERPMKKSRYTPDQVAFGLHQAEGAHWWRRSAARWAGLLKSLA